MGEDQSIHLLLRVGDISVEHSLQARANKASLPMGITHIKKYATAVEQAKMRMLQDLTKQLTAELKTVIPELLKAVVEEQMQVLTQSSPEECSHCHCRWQGFYRPHSPGCPRASEEAMVEYRLKHPDYPG